MHLNKTYHARTTQKTFVKAPQSNSTLLVKSVDQHKFQRDLWQRCVSQDIYNLNWLMAFTKKNEYRQTKRTSLIVYETDIVILKDVCKISKEMS